MTDEEKQKLRELASMACGDAKHTAAVAIVNHLVRLRWSNAEVHYYVGGPLTQMRELLLAYFVESGLTGDQINEMLERPEHRRDEPTEAQRRASEFDELHSAVRKAYEALCSGDDERALRLLEEAV